MVEQPSVVVADEPTGALDSANGAMVVDVLRRMSREGCAVVVATHNDGVRDSCDRVFDVHAQATVAGAGAPAP
ncbi:ABC-type lipoprotein export system ATPase subunit [Streptomonospora salina]|uniref:ABC-type lipoprotein export system ATPase subunit n=1 Tax=Streptomonospora salina TaxID=104205 RepID=A0A841E3Z0_9ACTN|nr:ABC-type lipoprotein export system ATPase subunit [Streptomonospora salina]